jgi:transposase-like protein
MQLKSKSTQNLKEQTSVTVTNSIPKHPDPEVPEKKTRRRFTSKYKMQILAEIDACTLPGDIGAILRREGLYSSNISKWRQQCQDGARKGLAPKKRGRKKQEISPMAKRIEELERENKRLAGKLKQAETIIDVQKKISEVFGIAQPESNDKKS